MNFKKLKIKCQFVSFNVVTYHSCLSLKEVIKKHCFGRVSKGNFWVRKYQVGIEYDFRGDRSTIRNAHPYPSGSKEYLIANCLW